MDIIHFSEHQYRERLLELHTKERIAFASACAERLFSAYVKFNALSKRGDANALRSVLSKLWGDLMGEVMSIRDLNDCLETVMNLIPQEGEAEWIPEQAPAEDASAALAYALRCRQNGSEEEAAWAARRAYEATDYYVNNLNSLLLRSRASEEDIISHPIIQKELGRQLRDMDELRRGVISIEKLRERAQQDSKDFLP